MTAPSEQPWHTLPVPDVAARLRTDADAGLASDEAQRRLKEHGPNTIEQAPPRSVGAMLLDQFRSIIVALLLAATLISFLLGDHVESVAILVVIVLNAAIGFFTEWKAQQALTALREQAAPVATVIRDGDQTEIPSAALVPGDLVVLAAGARVPADGRIVESVQLQIGEASLTGESHAVQKSPESVADADAPLGDRLSMAFLGTTINEGRGRLLVTATGARTEVGHIGALIDDSVDRSTPLEQKMKRLGELLVVVILVLCALIVLTGWLRGVADFLPMLEIGLSLAVAAVPEGLPAVTTMTLALGMQRMARQRALVRRLPAVETLGSTTVICTDKTGTLTRNEMTVTALALHERRIEVGGAGYVAEGEFTSDGTPVDASRDKPLTLALRIGALCNDAQVDHEDGVHRVLGDPTEAALLVAAEKAGSTRETLEAEYPRIGEVPFDSESKRMVTIHRTPDGRTVAYLKGSPGTLWTASSHHVVDDGQVAPLTPEGRKGLEASNAALAGAALRVLGLAYRELPEDHSADDLADGLTFVGLVGMSDPLRDEAKPAIETCRDAGIRIVMITGDQELTAAEIARQLGIDRDREDRALRTVHGRELKDLDASGWQRIVAEAAVFARVSPEHKLQIVDALQQEGHIVAMTGDGVNDAPALKKADIGIAMGIKGTEVAKENADMVITDDNFASIVGAVEQGRIIYGNILRFIHYLFSCNWSEILTVFVALMVGWPLPLAVLQILWLNLITDVFPAFALALEPSAPDVMKRPPRDPKESLLPPRFVMLIVLQGMLLAAVTLLAFDIGLRWYGDEGEGLRHAKTMAFMTLAFAQIFHAFNARSRRRSIFTRRLFTNPWLWAAVVVCVGLQLAAVHLPLLQRILQTSVLATQAWGVILGCSLVPIVVVELAKAVSRAIHPAGAAKEPRAAA